MTLDQILEILNVLLEPQPFTPIERFVFRQSWLGDTYSEMATNSGYESAYIKEVGIGLWQKLSDVLEEKITKKNLRLILEDCLQKKIAELDTKTQLKLVKINRASSFPVQLSLQEYTIDFPGSPLPFNSPLYIYRSHCEAIADQHITHSGCLLRIKAPKKTGKSSLINLILARAYSQGYWAVAGSTESGYCVGGTYFFNGYIDELPCALKKPVGIRS